MNIITNNAKEANRALEFLKKIRDPEIGLNIVDLGLLYQIDFDESHLIYVSMTLTTRFCPMSHTMKQSVETALKVAFPENTVIVNLVFDPPWTAKNISSEGKLLLNGKSTI